MRDAIAATELETFYGGIKFAPEGNNIAKPMVLRQIQDGGKYNVVAPSKWASAKARTCRLPSNQRRLRFDWHGRRGNRPRRR